MDHVKKSLGRQQSVYGSEHTSSMTHHVSHQPGLISIFLGVILNTVSMTKVSNQTALKLLTMKKHMLQLKPKGRSYDRTRPLAKSLDIIAIVSGIPILCTSVEHFEKIKDRTSEVFFFFSFNKLRRHLEKSISVTIAFYKKMNNLRETAKFEQRLKYIAPDLCETEEFRLYVLSDTIGRLCDKFMKHFEVVPSEHPSVVSGGEEGIVFNWHGHQLLSAMFSTLVETGGQDPVDLPVEMTSYFTSDEFRHGFTGFSPSVLKNMVVPDILKVTCQKFEWVLGVYDDQMKTLSHSEKVSS